MLQCATGTKINCLIIFEIHTITLQSIYLITIIQKAESWFLFSSSRGRNMTDYIFLGDEFLVKIHGMFGLLCEFVYFAEFLWRWRFGTKTPTAETS